MLEDYQLKEQLQLILIDSVGSLGFSEINAKRTLVLTHPNLKTSQVLLVFVPPDPF